MIAKIRAKDVNRSNKSQARKLLPQGVRLGENAPLPECLFANVGCQPQPGKLRESSPCEPENVASQFRSRIISRVNLHLFRKLVVIHIEHIMFIACRFWQPYAVRLIVSVRSRALVLGKSFAELETLIAGVILHKALLLRFAVSQVVLIASYRLHQSCD